MLILRLVIWMLSIGMMVLGAGMVSGQDYPSKPIRIVTTNAGGGADFVARLIAQGLITNLRQSVIVDNRPGSAIISGEIVARANPDGYTLLVGSDGMWIVPLLQKNPPYDPVRDFSPITITSMENNILVVHPSVAVKSVKDLIDLAKAKPGVLNYGSGPVGASSHSLAELFKSMAGVNIVGIFFQGGSQALNALIGGEVQVGFTSASNTMPLVKSGRLRALAVTSSQPSALAPGLPTVAATVPGFELVPVNVMFAPARTPAAIIRRLNQEIVRVLNQPDVKQKFFDSGVEVIGSSPEELAAGMKANMAKVGKIIKDAGIQAN